MLKNTNLKTTRTRLLMKFACKAIEALMYRACYSHMPLCRECEIISTHMA